MRQGTPTGRSCGGLVGYYAVRLRSRQAPVVCADSVHLKAAFAASGRAYGSRPLCAALQKQGVAIGRYRVRTLMRANGLRLVWRRKFMYTTDSRHDLSVSPNVLARQFDQPLPNQAWVCDITYICTRSSWLYLAAVLDLHSCKIVDRAKVPEMPTPLVCAALQVAIAQHNPAQGLLVHSDRGRSTQVACIRPLLTKHDLVGSVSRKGNGWDNSVMKRFFLNLK